jgi:uncharacterized protein YbgA (DUF1722 family)
MQARNIAIVDSTIREMEEASLAAYIESERTPLIELTIQSAHSQMWIFSLYEFLRTWRQRADEILRLSAQYRSLDVVDRSPYLESAVKKAEEKEGMILTAISFYSDHIKKIEDNDFVDSVDSYRERTESLFRSCEALRITLAKHEIPKSRFIAEAPGYGRMSYNDGSMYWFVTLKDGSQLQVNRRELGNSFLDIDDEPI